MRKIALIGMVLVTLTTLGCSKKSEEPAMSPAPAPEQQAAPMSGDSMNKSEDQATPMSNDSMDNSEEPAAPMSDNSTMDESSESAGSTNDSDESKSSGD